MQDPRKANKSFDDNGLQYVWDSTSIKLAETCSRKYYYQMIEGWQPKDLSVHLRFGQHYATALEHYYKHRAFGHSSADALDLVLQEALEATWDEPRCSCDGYQHECPDCGGDGKLPAGPWDSGHNLKTRETLIRTIVWYVDQFEDEQIEVIKLGDGSPAVEHSFTLEADDGVIFSGHLDRLVTYGSHPYVMDQKTTGGNTSAYYFKQFDTDTQMSMYTFAGKAIFGIPVKGVIIDAVQVAVGFSRYERGFTFRTDAQLSEWYEDTMDTITRLRHQTMEQYFPMNRASCGNYGGCPFREVCSRDPSVRENFLKADFVRGPTWDPLTRR